MRRILRFGSRKSIKKGKRKLRRANNHHWGIEWQILSATFNLHGFLVHIFHLFSCYCCHQMRFSRLFFYSSVRKISISILTVTVSDSIRVFFYATTAFSLVFFAVEYQKSVKILTLVREVMEITSNVTAFFV